MIKFVSLDFLGVSYRIPSKDKNAVYRLQISALVLEIFKEARKGFLVAIVFVER